MKYEAQIHDLESKLAASEKARILLDNEKADLNISIGFLQLHIKDLESKLAASEAENTRLRELCEESYELIRYEPSEPEEADLAQRLKQAMKPEEAR